ncbi:cytochrome P450 [Tumebacillus flagellatus]|uniref:Cytochrome P450 n=1 Tax=Tumebacillus flagellatus TaxID=1157490 RepID=A0A074LPW8_9BACL|nr:cytochrome P450 [Tumebacillus flagellatus]KEO83114.1 hypothetical protein EL26_11640 [Tumebacillus flagellatus]
MQPSTQKRAAIHIPPMEELNTPEKQKNAFEVFRKLRETTPIRYCEKRQMWEFFLYEDCVRILKDPKTFSSQLNRAGSTVASIITTDPPRHKDVRSLVEKAFTAKRVANLEPAIRSIANELLDDVIENGRMDTFFDFAGPLPVIVIADLLGVPNEDRRLFKKLSMQIASGVQDDSEESYEIVRQNNAEARRQLTVYLQGILDQRKVEPKDDLITAVWQSNLEENILSEPELVNFYITLLVAGNETTSNLITSGVRALTEHPELQEQLTNRPELIPNFVEEVLRFYPPSTQIPRIATQDVEIRGHLIQAGDMVNCWTVSANRDAAKFANAEDFDADRKPNLHIAFGFGTHFCLGAPLARLEGQVVFETLLQRLCDIRLTDPERAVLQPFPRFTSMHEYPVAFTGKS